MHEMKEKLIRTGTAILNASRTELYVSMRFLDIALSSLSYEMDLSMKTIGTDSRTIRYNPAWLTDNYRNDSVLVNRAYLHMLLHCIFRHMFHNTDKDEDIWNLSCDIAVTAIIDEMDNRCVRLTVPDERQAMYDRLHGEMKVLTAEGIYRYLTAHPMPWLEMEKLKKYFIVDDHVFWKSEGKDENQGSGSSGDDQNQHDDRSDDDRGNNESDSNGDNEYSDNDQQDKQQKQQERQELEQQWREISEKMRTNMETCSKEAAEKAGSLYDYVKIATRERYDYRRFLQKFTTIREEIRLDPDSFDYIYYTYGLEHYGNMPLIEDLEYKEVKKIEELAIVIDTSESCSGEYVRRFLEETFAILSGKDNFFKKMNVHIIQCDAKAQTDDVITCEEDMKHYMENFRLSGFGGTDFRPAFEYVNELCLRKVFKKLKGLLYFTDGYGEYPKRRPDYEAAFVFLEENYNDRHVPPWAIKLILGPEDILMGGNEYEH